MDLQILVVILNALCVAIYGGMAVAYKQSRLINAILCAIWVIVLLLNLYVLTLR